MERNVRRNVISNEILKLERDLLERLENGRAEIGITKAVLEPDQELCHSLLVDGKPQAFVELFDITTTLKIDPTPEEDLKAGILNPIAEAQKTLKQKDTLQALCGHLKVAEIAARSDDAQKAFTAHSGIAEIFDSTCYYEKSVEYYSKGLAAAIKSKNDTNISQVKYYLGKVHWKMHHTKEAVKCYEDCLSIAKKNFDEERTILAARDLLEAYWYTAERRRSHEDFESSIKYYEKAKGMAEICQDDPRGADALHNIGLLYAKLHDIENSLKYQSEYLQYSCRVDDKAGECKARASMAEAYETSGDVRAAVKQLLAYQLAAKNVDIETQAKGHCLLGMLYQRHKERQLSLDHFEKYFELAVTLGNPDFIDVARVNISIATQLRSQQRCEF